MKKPNIAKRLLPLLDIILILLALFLILPHGIKSNEILENTRLKKQSEDLSKKIKFYKWYFDKSEQIKKDNSFDKILLISISNNKIYIKEKEIKKDNIENKLKKITKEENINFSIIKVFDPGKPYTKSGTIRKIEKSLDKLNIVNVITTDIRQGIS